MVVSEFCKTMNYYEELGIRRNASTAEIREAYKLAARLLHPDLQREPRLKELAECQMRRLSDLLTMLADPRERARYDATLLGEARPATWPIPAADGGPDLWQSAARHWFWVLLGFLTLAMGVCYYALVRGADVPPQAAAAGKMTAPAAPAVTQGSPARVNARPAKTAEAASAPRVEHAPPLKKNVREAIKPIARAAVATPEPAPAAAAMEPTAALPVARQAPLPDGARRESEPRFAGQWLLAADAGGQDNAGGYPAVYVEFRLHDEHGNLAGDYRALYSRINVAISPEVAFHAHGELPAGNSGTLVWESSAGAKGEMEVTLRPPNGLVVKWWTTQFGRQEVLSSGMAVLTRLKNP